MGLPPVVLPHAKIPMSWIVRGQGDLLDSRQETMFEMAETGPTV